MRAALLTVALVCAAGVARAQGAPPPDAAPDAATTGAAGAEAAVGAYVEAFADGDQAGAARLLDPVELEGFVGLLRQMAELDDSGLFDVEPGAAPAETFARFLRAIVDAEPLYGDALGSLTGTVVGSVPEGDSLRHVVVRSRFQLDGSEVGAVALTTARWTGARWVVTFDEKMRQFQQGIEAAVSARGE